MTEVDWSGRRVLVTGHTGFKGAWLCRVLRSRGAVIHGFALPCTDPRALAALLPAVDHEDIGDVRDLEAVRRTVAHARPEVVFHFAAQAIVSEGWLDPTATFHTNVMGTSNLFEAIRGSGTDTRAVVVATSDKVYRNNDDGRAFVESDHLGGTDPYSASKAATEHVVTAWRSALPEARLASVRAGNVIGGGDRGRDRLLPDLMRAAEGGHSLALRNPAATRPWQHVLDAVDGYVLLAERLLTSPDDAPLALNLGPDSRDGAMSVGDVVAIAAPFLGATVAEAATPSFPETSRLQVDASLARRELGWSTRLRTTEAVTWAAEWYAAQQHGSDLVAVTDAQIAQHNGLPR